MDKKKFICKWGDWDDHGISSYEPREEEVSESFFSKSNGYEEEDINAIDMLEIGEQYDITSGNQIVERIK
ncbi:hypothetical protein [Pontibacter anaerobius]|uniref:Uncharacterized protein n=1 Tax=Pontibacter anaerobius TaxID=2993940 RepID=A0ABT3RGH0_9BACT|nr:hypothetical protein [Pontibacter anaerobius]MCX2740734.1 hypothetical protein [Pontibacter anaerobius]